MEPNWQKNGQKWSMTSGYIDTADALLCGPWGMGRIVGCRISECRKNEPRPADLKLFKVILGKARGRLADAFAGKEFSASCTDLRRTLGKANPMSDKEILEGLWHLQQTTLAIDYVLEGQIRRRCYNLLSATSVDAPDGAVYWKFSSEVAYFLDNPRHVVPIFLRVAASLSSHASLRLYESLAPSAWSTGCIEYSVNDLKERLVVGDRKTCEGWSEFNCSVLRPALEDVNDHAPFRAEVTLVRGPRDKVLSVRFSVSPKSGQ